MIFVVANSWHDRQRDALRDCRRVGRSQQATGQQANGVEVTRWFYRNSRDKSSLKDVKACGVAALAAFCMLKAAKAATPVGSLIAQHDLSQETL